MTVEELRAKIESVLSLGDLLKRFIPGEVDDRIIEYGRAIVHCDEFLALIVEDVFPDDDGPFMGGGHELSVTAADGTVEAIDPATLALIVQLITTFGPIVLEWIRKRRER